MNWGFFETTLATAGALALLSFFVFPFYIAMYSAMLKVRTKMQLEFIEAAQELGSKSMLDDAIERMFEEGVTE